MRSQVLPHKAKFLSRLLNIFIIVAVCLLAAILIQKYYLDDSEGPVIGRSARIAISGLDWTKAEHTLLIAIQEDCNYCTESARFYRQIIQGLSGRDDVRVVAVFPGNVFVGMSYLTQLGLVVDESKEASLVSLGIKQVPALVLVDKQGIVSDVWMGQLPPKKEAEVVAALDLKNTRPASEWTMDETEVKRRFEKHEPVLVLDLRERSAYAQNHWDGAKNVPRDELDARAMNELSPSDTIVLDGDNELMIDAAYSTLSRLGFSSVYIMRRTATRQ